MVDYKTRPLVQLESYKLNTEEGVLAARRELSRRINQIIRDAGVNWLGEVTLEAAATTTTVVDDLVTGESIVLLMPKTYNAAQNQPLCFVGDADFDPGAPYLTNEVGRFTINHPNPLPADCEFRYAIIG